MSLPRKIARLNPFVAGVLLGLCLVTPTFAATFENPLPPRDWLLMGSLVLLAVALAMKLMRDRSTDTDAGTMDMDSDLRWWRNAS